MILEVDLSCWINSSLFEDGGSFPIGKERGEMGKLRARRRIR